jgi:NAD+ diphosphatase
MRKAMIEFTYCPGCTAPLSTQIIDLEARRACSRNCGFVYYDNPTPVVAAIVEHNGLIVLARNRAWPTVFYGLITGYVERCESPQSAVVREVKEELNLDAQSATFVSMHVFERMNQLVIGYHVAASGTIRLNDELFDCRHVRPQDCQVWPLGTGLVLRDWLRSRGYDPQMIPSAS